MAEVDTSRLVEIWCPPPSRVGSGFRISRRHILTARHVVETGTGLALQVEVRLYDPLGSLPWLPASVHWDNAATDLALLDVGDGALPEPESASAPWGELAGKSQLAVAGVGFPNAARRPDGRRDTWSIRGQLDPQHEARQFAAGIATVHVDKSIVPRRTESGTPWAGASGAAVFSHETGHLVGILVVKHDVAPELNVLRVSLVAADHGLIHEVRALGIGVEKLRAGATAPAVPPHLKFTAVGFVDRVDHLRKIGEMLDQTADGTHLGVAIVTGMSGLGKSRLASQYARSALDSYDLVWHIDAAKEYMDRELNELAVALGVAVNQVASIPDIRAMMWRKLAERQRWLLIFDDAKPDDLLPQIPREQEETVSRWPTCTNGHLIITSNRTDWGSYRRCMLRLDAMSEQDALELLRDQSEQDDLDLQDTVDTVRELGYLPIYVEQAGRWISSGGRSAREYLASLRGNFSILAKNVQGGGEMDRKGAASWLTSFQDMQRQRVDGHPAGADAAELLRLLAYFAPDNIPRDLLERHAQQATARLRSVLANSLRTTRAIQMLVRYAFVKATPNMVSMHRLVQEATRTQLRREPVHARECAGAAVQILAAAFPADPEDPASWQECEQLIPHAEVTAGYAGELQVVTEESARLLHRCGRYLLIRSSVRRAEEILRSALRLLADDGTGDYQPGAADILTTLSSALHTTAGRLVDARKTAEEAIAIRERSGGPAGIELAHDLTMLGSACRELKDFPAALRAQQRSLGILLIACGPDAPETAESSDYLGRTLWRMGNLRSARTALELAIRITAGVAPSSRTAMARRYLGLVARDGADYDLARQHLDESHRTLATLLRPEHRDALKSECLLAGVLAVAGGLCPEASAERREYFHQAASHFQHVFAELPKVLGTAHGDMAEALILRSALLRATGRLAEARDDLDTAFRIFADSHGKDDPYLGHVYLHRAPVLAALGETSRAEDEYGQALRLYRTGFGERHPYVADTYLELASFRDSQGQEEEAAHLRAQAGSIRDYANST